MQAARWPAFAPAGTRSSGSIAWHSGSRSGSAGGSGSPAGLRSGSASHPGGSAARWTARGSRWGTTEMSAFVYGCLRVPDDLARRPLLDDPAQVHDRDPVGEVGGGGEVVRDHEDAEAAAAELVEEREDPGADGDVEHRDGLVRDEQLGSSTRLAAIATRWRWPPESSCGIAVEEELGRRQPGPRRARRAPAARARLAPPPSPWTSSGSSTVSRTRKRGSSDSYGSWKMSCTSRRRAAQLCARRRRRCPRRGSERPRTRASTSRRIVCAVVVLPLPDSPTSASISPSRSEKETPSTARTVQLRAAREGADEPAWNREVGDEVLDLEQRRPPFSLTGERRHDAALSAGSLRWHAAAWPVVGREQPRLHRRAGRERPSRSAARTGSPTISRSRRGGVPGNGDHLVVAVEVGRRREEQPRVRMARIVVERVRRLRPRRSRRRT